MLLPDGPGAQKYCARDDKMRYKRFVGGNLESNGYVLFQKPGGAALIVDPGYNAKVFIKCLEELDLRLEGILLTHLHSDHVGAVPGLLAYTDCPVYMHRLDADAYKGRVDVPLEDGDIVMLENESIKVIHTPGHTRGSVCFMCPESRLCFTGDTVFDTDLGRTDLAGGSEKEMERTIRDVVNSWSGDIMILPGHDDGCSMAAVRKYNTEFRSILAGEGRSTVWE